MPTKKRTRKKEKKSFTYYEITNGKLVRRLKNVQDAHLLWHIIKEKTQGIHVENVHIRSTKRLQRSNNDDSPPFEGDSTTIKWMRFLFSH